MGKTISDQLADNDFIRSYADLTYKTLKMIAHFGRFFVYTLCGLK